jgi:hypothetical protein
MAAFYRRRLPLLDHVNSARRTFESPNRRIAVRAQDGYEAHRAAPFRASR